MQGGGGGNGPDQALGRRNLLSFRLLSITVLKQAACCYAETRPPTAHTTGPCSTLLHLLASFISSSAHPAML